MVPEGRTFILGSGTCVPSLSRSSCAALVAWNGQHILLDAGPGTMHQLLRLGVSIDEIDAIALSHFHLDHVGEVAPFLFSTRYPRLSRSKPLTLIGGQGLGDWFEGLSLAHGRSIELPPPWLSLLELEERGDFMLGGIRISFETMAHKPESRGFRFEGPGGLSLVYSGDTDETDTLVRLARGADTLICECAMPEGKKMTGHLTPSLAGRLAQKAGVKRLVLTHLYPQCEEEDLISPCAAVYSGKIVLAEDLMAL